jgi:hypothetical protein
MIRLDRGEISCLPQLKLSKGKGVVIVVVVVSIIIFFGQQYRT